VSGACVIVDSMPEVRSDDRGRFIISRVAPGTRQIQVLTTGTQPATAIVDVVALDTAHVRIVLQRVTTLAPVTVRAPATVRERWANDLEERKQKGWGKFMDSTTIMHYPSLQHAISMNLSHIPCAYYLDGILVQDLPKGEALKQVMARDPGSFALMEIQFGPAIPLEFLPTECAKALRSTTTVVLLWTKLGR
jgi:hypothetical protein